MHERAKLMVAGDTAALQRRRFDSIPTIRCNHQTDMVNIKCKFRKHVIFLGIPSVFVFLFNRLDRTGSVLMLVKNTANEAFLMKYLGKPPHGSYFLMINYNER